MSDESFALTPRAQPATEADYGAIHAAVMETERGRWFLHEYARRNRHADTRLLLAAIERIEAAIRLQKKSSAAAFVWRLHDLSKTIAQARKNRIAMKPEGEANGKSGDFDTIADTLAAAATRIRDAVDRVQEVAWRMRELDAQDRNCDELEIHAAEILADCSVLDELQSAAQSMAALLHDLDIRIGEMMAPPDQHITTPADRGVAQTATTPPEAAPSVAEMPQPTSRAGSADIAEPGTSDKPKAVTVQEAAIPADKSLAESLSSTVGSGAPNSPPRPEPQWLSRLAPALIATGAPASATRRDVVATAKTDVVADARPQLFIPVNAAEAAPVTSNPPAPAMTAADSAAPCASSMPEPPEAGAAELAVARNAGPGPVLAPSMRAPAKPRVLPGDPLAPIMALSDEEKIALFS